MGDVDHGHAAGAQPADGLEEAFELVLSQHGRGLVHDHDARFDGERPGDGHHLALGHGEAAQRHAHIEVGAQLSQDGLGALVERPPVDEHSAARRGPAQEDVLGGI